MINTPFIYLLLSITFGFISSCSSDEITLGENAGLNNPGENLVLLADANSLATSERPAETRGVVPSVKRKVILRDGVLS